MKKFILFILCSFVLLSSCERKHKAKRGKQVKIHIYSLPVANSTVTETDDFIWYYIVYLDKKSDNYIYTTSSNVLESYLDVVWTRSSEIPLPDRGLMEYEKEETEQLEELPEEFQTEIDGEEIFDIEIDMDQEFDNDVDIDVDVDGGDSGGDGGGDGD